MIIEIDCGTRATGTRATKYQNRVVSGLGQNIMFTCTVHALQRTRNGTSNGMSLNGTTARRHQTRIVETDCWHIHRPRGRPRQAEFSFTFWCSTHARALTSHAFLIRWFLVHFLVFHFEFCSPFFLSIRGDCLIQPQVPLILLQKPGSPRVRFTCFDFGNHVHFVAHYTQTTWAISSLEFHVALVRGAQWDTIAQHQTIQSVQSDRQIIIIIVVPQSRTLDQF